MKVFLAGATGVIGRRLLPKLLEAGHEVAALTRSPERAEGLRERGAEPIVGDVFDREGLQQAVASASPEAVIHQLTALPKRINPRKVRRDLAATNRIRTEGTRNLMAAAQASGVRRFVAQSISFVCVPGGEGLTTEETPLHLDAPRAYAELIHAVNTLEQVTTGTEGVEGLALRYGFFYGPGTIYAPDGTFHEDVRRRRIPLVGPGTGVFSFIHIDDAAEATVLALEKGAPGVLNVVDDHPVPSNVWIPHYATAIGAKPPRWAPTFLARLGGGPYAVYMMVEQRGASNAKAKQALGWSPSYPTWEEHLATG